MKTVITYGTFDLLHVGHINLLKRARVMGDRLIVGLSTDAFNNKKHKHALMSFWERKIVLESLRYVDIVIPERSWGQKRSDIRRHGADILVMGSDWAGQFDELSALCRVVYVPRTKGISTSALKRYTGPRKKKPYRSSRAA